MKQMRLKYILVVALSLAVRSLSDSEIDDINLEDFPLESEGSQPQEETEDLSDIDILEEEASGVTSSSVHQSAEQQLLTAIATAMRRPAMRQQLGQVLPILRSMSPTQRLALAALLTSRLGSEAGGEATPQQLAAMLGTAQKEELLLPLSVDIANMFKPDSQQPEALELRQQRGPPSISRQRELAMSIRARQPQGHNRRNALVPTDMVPPPPPRSIRRRRPSTTKQPKPVREQTTPTSPPAEEDCVYFTNTLCLEVNDYPDDAIMASIHRNKNTIQALLAEYKPTQEGESEQRYLAARRQDVVGSNEGALCPTMVKYARPKRARATSGQWKFVVNVGDYTQTLRLEMCTKPQESCSFVSENFRSSCGQVFNYHRLLTWDESRGLHMDIFKVPTCCSCHVQGYAFNFPPRGSGGHVDGSGKQEEFPGVDFASSDERGQTQRLPFHNAPQDADFRQETSDLGGGHIFQDTKFGQGPLSFGPNVKFGQNNGAISFSESRPFDGLSTSFQDTSVFHVQDLDVRGTSLQAPRRVPKPDKHNFQRQGFRRPGPGPVPFSGPTPLPLAHEHEFPPFAENQLRRSRNQTSPPVDLDFSASSPQRRPHPHVITSDAIRGTTSTTVRLVTSTSAPKSSSTDPSHRRVNYNYHPIIDFFKNEDNNQLEARKGQEWTPIVGDSKPRADTSDPEASST